MVCAFTAMLFINIFSLKISTMSLMLTAAAVSLICFAAKPRSSRKAVRQNDLSRLVFGFSAGRMFCVWRRLCGAIPLIRDVVLAYGWLSDEALTAMIAVSESTPGPIMVNLATYVGSDQAGLPEPWPPRWRLCRLLSHSVADNRRFKSFIENDYVQAVLGGLKPCMIGMILATGVFMTVSPVFSQSAGQSVDPPDCYYDNPAGHSDVGIQDRDEEENFTDRIHHPVRRSGNHPFRFIRESPRCRPRLPQALNPGRVML